MPGLSLEARYALVRECERAALASLRVPGTRRLALTPCDARVLRALCFDFHSAVSEHGPEPGVERLHALQQATEVVGVLDVGRMHDHAEQQSLRVHRDVALAPLQPLGGIPAARPPFSVVLTLWVSMMAAVGLASRPAPSRSMTTRWWRMLSHTPAARKARK